jgi:hypothetical protein
MDTHKESRKAVTTDLLPQYNTGGMSFLLQIVMGDETWVNHFEPKSKQQLMEWCHMLLPRNKKFRNVPSAEKVMVTAFWE